MISIFRMPFQFWFLWGRNKDKEYFVILCTPPYNYRIEKSYHLGAGNLPQDFLDTFVTDAGVEICLRR
jgi:hypothetical protein